MKKYCLCFFLFLFAVPLSVAQTAKAVSVGNIPSVVPLKTACQTDHQGEHLITEARGMVKDGTLHLHFPMNPAYHLVTDITVRNGTFFTALAWQPIYASGPVTLTLTHERLMLEKARYAPGDIVNGYLDLAFTVTGDKGVIPHGEQAYYVRGPFSVIARPEGFDPLAEDNISAYDLDTALYELGLPHHAFEWSFLKNNLAIAKRLDAPPFDYTGEMRPPGLHGITDGFFNAHPQPPGKVVREITWDINPHAPFSDGPERLTIWFAQSGNAWKPLGYRKWVNTAFSGNGQ